MNERTMRIYSFSTLTSISAASSVLWSTDNTVKLSTSLFARMAGTNCLHRGCTHFVDFANFCTGGNGSAETLNVRISSILQIVGHFVSGGCTGGRLRERS